MKIIVSFDSSPPQTSSHLNDTYSLLLYRPFPPSCYFFIPSFIPILSQVNKAFEGDASTARPLSGSVPEARGTLTTLQREVNPDTGQVTLRDSIENNIIMSPWVCTSKYLRIFSKNRFGALFIKNFIKLWRNKVSPWPQ
ncbi:hypothetical protein GWK47_051585 [Chionoecetes opilio]|uniref:Uncharacterized protein n=1 Tax=Chionoecetes opilio TaxID=41210 RepID=A0A8J4Y0N0_CHIOP|nr:hypothetical protein GWK47_051585 [Chionoecetes opilio]